MAEIVSCIAIGAQLALGLYSLADGVKAARGEILAVAQDISLFCAVLKQFKNSLDQPSRGREPTSALDTAYKITSRCQEIFEEIDGILKDLRVDSHVASQTPISFITRAKWLFKRSNVRLLRGDLNSMKLTFQIMLMAMDSEKRASQRPVLQCPGENVGTDSSDTLLQRTLERTHAASLEELRELEDICALEEFAVTGGHVGAASETQSLNDAGDPLLLRGEINTADVRSIDGSMSLMSFTASTSRANRPRTSVWLANLTSEYLPLGTSAEGSVVSDLWSHGPPSRGPSTPVSLHVTPVSKILTARRQFGNGNDEYILCVRQMMEALKVAAAADQIELNNLQIYSADRHKRLETSLDLCANQCSQIIEPRRAYLRQGLIELNHNDEYKLKGVNRAAENLQKFSVKFRESMREQTHFDANDVEQYLLQTTRCSEDQLKALGRHERKLMNYPTKIDDGYRHQLEDSQTQEQRYWDDVKRSRKHTFMVSEGNWNRLERRLASFKQNLLTELSIAELNVEIIPP